MGSSYAALKDVATLGYTLTAQQTEAAETLLSTASAKLRVIAKKHGKNLDEMCRDEDFEIAVKSTVIQAVMRALNSISETSPAVSQDTETNGSYSISMTYLNAGQSLYFLRNELKDLGLLRQTYGAIELYNTTEEV